MGKKKKIMEEALLKAEEIERATFDNAKDVIIESFKPDLVEFYKDVMDEDEEDLPEGTEHDIRRYISLIQTRGHSVEMLTHASSPYSSHRVNSYFLFVGHMT